jgi:hypothetical protein
MIMYLAGELIAIDEEDYNEVSKHRWYKHTNKKGYVNFQTTKKPTTLLTSVLFKSKKGFVVDHISGNVFNNLRSNLRLCTRAENNKNRGLSVVNTSGYVGVTYNKRFSKWQAQIKSNNKNHYLGLFSTPEEASEVYEREAKKLYGTFARVR